MSAPVVWFEVVGHDLPELTGFYGDLFGWKIDTENPMGYGMVDTGTSTGIPGGIYAVDDRAREYVTFYVQVPDVGAALVKAEGLGAKVVQPATDLPAGPTVGPPRRPPGPRRRPRAGLTQGSLRNVRNVRRTTAAGSTSHVRERRRVPLPFAALQLASGLRQRSRHG